MRKETKEIMTAFLAGKSMQKARTSTDGNAVFLHGHKIIERVPDGYNLTLAGWPTLTTRERLNGFLESIGEMRAGFVQSKGKQYFVTGNFDKREIADDEIIFIEKE